MKKIYEIVRLIFKRGKYTEEESKELIPFEKILIRLMLSLLLWFCTYIAFGVCNLLNSRVLIVEGDFSKLVALFILYFFASKFAPDINN